MAAGSLATGLPGKPAHTKGATKSTPSTETGDHASARNRADLGSLGSAFGRTAKVSAAGAAVAPPEPLVAPLEPLLVPDDVAPPAVPPSAGLVVVLPVVDVVPEGAEDFAALLDPLLATDFGLATGVWLVDPPDVVPPELAVPPTGSVTRLVAPPLDVDVLVGAAARFVPTVLAVAGRRTAEVFGASGLAGAGVLGAAAPEEPFASRPAARSPASGV